MDGRVGNQYLVASLAKGLHVLRIVATAPGPLRLPEVASAAGYPQATTYRLLRTLEHQGFLRLTDDQRYAPGMAILTLGFDTLASMDIVQVAAPVLARAAATTGDAANLSVLVNGSVLILHRTGGTTFVRPTAAVGSMLPAAATSAGKAILAALEGDELETVLAQLDLTAGRGPHAIRDLDALRRDLEVTRERGWALQDEEIVAGLRSIAACVYDAAQRPVASVNLSFGVAGELDETLHQFVPVLLQAAQEVSALLGNRQRR